MIGDKLASAMQLFGNPSCINTAKIMQTAGEKGVDVEVHKINGGEEVSEMSPLQSAPVLKAVSYTHLTLPTICSV